MSEKEEVRPEVLAGQKESRLSQEIHENWCEEAVENGFGPCESVRRTSRQHRAQRKAEI